MRSKKKALEMISKRLKDIPWAIFAGTAVEIYTKGKRRGNDIDIIVPGDKIDEVAKRFNAEVILETRKKGNVKLVNDYHIEITICGILVEFVGKTEKIIIGGKQYNSTQDLRRKLFRKAKKRKYLGVNVFVLPVEEILVSKMLFNRSGEWQDKEDVKLLLKTKKIKIDKRNLIHALNRWGVSKKKQGIFIKKLIE